MRRRRADERWAWEDLWRSPPPRRGALGIRLAALAVGVVVLVGVLVPTGLVRGGACLRGIGCARSDALGLRVDRPERPVVIVVR